VIEAGAGFAAVLLLIALRVPVAVAMGLVGAAGLWWVWGPASLAFVLGKAPFDAIATPSLAVVPLFVMMGVFAGRGGLSRALYEAARAFLGHRRGGLALATVGASALFGAICGSSLATAATIGKVAMPEMRRAGYPDRLAAASVAAGGTLGVMIPPSVLFVVYGLMTEQSIGKLFAAGLLPGLLGMLLYMGAVRLSTRAGTAGAVAPRLPWRARLATLARIWQTVLLLLLVLVGMYAGLFTPSEAAAVGAAGALLLTWLNGQLSLPVLRDGLLETVLTTAMIFAILIGASIFNAFVDATGLARVVIDQVAALGADPLLVLLALALLYLILGCLMDSLSMILLTIGAVFPVIKGLGIDPIWFGVFLVTLAEIGLITPPVGMNLFVLQSTVPGLDLATVSRGILPFVAADGVRLVLLLALPGLATWLPGVLFG
jgi:tripartite ATP-independent transporter DctM subunit